MSKAPLNNSNWVIEKRLLASAYPGSPDPIIHKARLIKLEDSGINVFINLQELDELKTKKFKPYDITLTNHGLTLNDVDGIQYKTCKSLRTGLDLKFVGFPIPDKKIVSDANIIHISNFIVNDIYSGKNVLVHCHGGKGRTGTVIGIVLFKLYKLQGIPANSQQIIDLLQKSFNTRIDKGRHDKKSMPQTKVQFDQLKRIIDS